MARKDVTDKMVCEAYAEMDALRQKNLDYRFPYEILARKTGECEKVCYSAMERAEDRGLIDCGVSLRTGWLIEKRLGIEFPTNIKEFMGKTHQGKADDIAKGKWHCFDIPFNMVCGDMETATKIFEGLKSQSKNCKETFRFSLNKNN